MTTVSCLFLSIHWHLDDLRQSHDSEAPGMLLTPNFTFKTHGSSHYLPAYEASPLRFLISFANIVCFKDNYSFLLILHLISKCSLSPVFCISVNATLLCPPLIKSKFQKSLLFLSLFLLSLGTATHQQDLLTLLAKLSWMICFPLLQILCICYLHCYHLHPGFYYLFPNPLQLSPSGLPYFHLCAALFIVFMVDWFFYKKEWVKLYISSAWESPVAPTAHTSKSLKFMINYFLVWPCLSFTQFVQYPYTLQEICIFDNSK